MSSFRQRSGERMSSDTMNPQDLHNDHSFTAQFMDDSDQNYLQDFRNPGGFGFVQNHSMDQIKHEQFDINRSPSPNAFGGSTFAAQGDFDFQLFGKQEPPQQSINPALFDQPSPNQGVDPATLMQHHSPGLQPQTIQNTQQGLVILNSEYNNWEGIVGNPSFQTHRPAASERSDISSAAASPLFANQEYNEHHSPLIGSMGDFLNNDQVFGLESFTLSEPVHSVHHTPSQSPRIQPMPGRGHVSGSNSPYLLAQDVQYGYGRPPSNMMMPPPQLPQGTIQELRNRQAAAHAAQNADPMQYFGPHIQIEFAPPQRQPTFPGKPGIGVNEDALSPPPKSPQRRQRSHSDPYAVGSGQPVSRTTTPHRPHERRSSLSPSDAPVIHSGASTPCSVSPAASSSGKNRRESAPPVPEIERDKMLGLAKGPGFPGGGSGDPSRRVQKHPATFQCHLCPKKFTRAYNLRSHLRTHTDERPFVCTICGKAFARQHDRKRHEGLHSGEKKFVCRGQLKAGGMWGCGRRFARADALGRHFRSEAGRICIRPLLDEEHAERSRAQVEQHAAQVVMMHKLPHHQPLQYPDGGIMVGGQGGMVLPAALLQQYPALATMDWDAGGGGGISGAEGSGRSSFDASGEDFDDEEEGWDQGSHKSSFDGGERGGWGSDSGSHWLPQR
ncbi:hypothetical protein L211DRAFT_401357 [Terfezia boudieri ATCC MYA-4762]|uniref:C2H2-type domain-containing protein n=1 Tax=Terfezia boudieri ATCC MYA-4762 TaxID=1051890 RepID=A0A3N4M6T5_9PEZI|nr:hypothetical protein L211DRAFT_401357 [Terfezia boudieri ATCC MYA-4762]